ncbi:MAG: PD-(D/E)XK nuclease family protein [Erysipelotrichaceae bacterium]
MSSKFYLVKYQQRNSLINSLLKEENFLGNIVTKDLSGYFNIKEKYDSTPELIFQTLEIISQEINNLTFYKSIEGSITFAQELLSVYTTIQKHQANIEDYPNNSSADSDIKLLLSKMVKLKTYEAALLNCLDSPIDQNFYIYQYYSNHPLENLLLRKFKNHIYLESAPLLEVKEAQSVIDEIEWSAQSIIKNNLPLEDIRVSYPEEYKNDIYNIFAKYNLLQLDNNSEYLINSLKLMNSLTWNELNRENILALSYYLQPNKTKALQYYLIDLNYPLNKLNEPFDAIENYHYPQAEAARLKLLEILEPLLNKDFNSYQSYIKSLYNCGKQLIHSASDEKLYFTIKNTFKLIKQDYHNNIFNLVDYLLNTIKLKVISKLSLTHHHDIVSTKYHYRLGTNNDSYLLNYFYPALLSETALEQLKLPKLTKQETQALKLAQLSVLAEQKVIISYHTIDLNGSEVECDKQLFEVFNNYQQENIEPIIAYQNNYDYTYQLKLPPEMANDLFFKDKTIAGSITSFERYNKCNYAYYLNKGLKLSEPLSNNFSALTTGNIIHKALNILVEKYQKEYLNHIDEDELKEIINSSIDFQHLYTYKQPYYQLALKQLLQHLTIALTKLNNIEKQSNYEPFELEKTLTTTINIKDINVNITSIIDRIDKLESNLLIKDYKTGNTNFSFNDFVYGIKLQLLTYLLVVNDNYPTYQVNGLYYVPMLNNINKHSFKIQVKKGFIADTYHNIIQNDLELSGLTLTDNIQTISDFNIEQSAIKGLKYKVDGSLSGSVNAVELISQLKQLYELLVFKLQNGVININPIENNCTYCNYRAICQFNGLARTIPSKPKDLDNEEYFQKVLRSEYEQSKL